MSVCKKWINWRLGDVNMGRNMAKACLVSCLSCNETARGNKGWNYYVLPCNVFISKTASRNIKNVSTKTFWVLFIFSTLMCTLPLFVYPYLYLLVWTVLLFLSTKDIEQILGSLWIAGHLGHVVYSRIILLELNLLAFWHDVVQRRVVLATSRSTTMGHLWQSVMASPKLD